MIKKRRKIRQNLISRFVDNACGDASDRLEKMAPDANRPRHLKRFMKMVEARKKQMLDRILAE